MSPRFTGQASHTQASDTSTPSRLFPPLTAVQRVLCFGDLASGPWSDAAAASAVDIEYIIGQRLAGTALRNVPLLGRPLPEPLLSDLRAAAFDAMQRSVEVFRRSQDGLSALARCGVPFVVSKGAGIAVQSGRVGERPFMDVDVLVTPGHFRRAARILHSLGYAERDESRPPWSYFDRHCREAVNLVSRSGGSIDLHHRVPPWKWANGLAPDVVIAEAQQVVFAGERMPAASLEHNLLIAALHIVSDRNQPGATVMAWRDLLDLAGHADAITVVQQARRHGLDGWLTWIVDQCPGQLRPGPLTSILGASAVRIRHPYRLRRVARPEERTAPLVDYAFRLPTLNAIAYVFGMVVPAPAYLRRKYPEARLAYLRWWANIWGKLFGNAGAASADSRQSAPPTIASETVRPYARRTYHDGVLMLARMAARTRRPSDWQDETPPTFIVGCGRSGTTLVADLLGDHPQVQAFMEPYGRWAAIDPRTDFLGLYTRSDGSAMMDADMVDEEVQRRFTTVLRPRRELVMVEKSPINTLRLGYLRALAPRARFVHMVRPGAAVVESVEAMARRTVRVPGRGIFNEWWGIDDRKWRLLCRDAARMGRGLPADADDADDRVRGAFEGVLSLEEIDGWQAQLGDQLLTIRYEALGSSPADVLGRVAGHIGIDPDPQWLARSVARVRSPRAAEGPTLTLPNALWKRFEVVSQRFDLEMPIGTGRASADPAHQAEASLSMDPNARPAAMGDP